MTCPGPTGRTNYEPVLGTYDGGQVTFTITCLELKGFEYQPALNEDSVSMNFIGSDD